VAGAATQGAPNRSAIVGPRPSHRCRPRGRGHRWQGCGFRRGTGDGGVMNGKNDPFRMTKPASFGRLSQAFPSP